MKKNNRFNIFLYINSGLRCFSMPVLLVLMHILLYTPEASAASGSKAAITDLDWSFEGIFGHFDRAQLQRGFQVYKDTCSSCHSLDLVTFKSLSDEDGPAFSDLQIKEFMKDFYVVDQTTGESRSAVMTDRFPDPGTYDNAPDLSLITKARSGFHGPMGLGINKFLKGIGGPEYVYSLLTGYSGHEHTISGSVFYENEIFPGGMISMPPPLSEGMLQYPDVTPATVDQMAEDVVAFLSWTAEPKLTARKQAGFKSIVILAILSILLWFSYKELWKHTYKKESNGSE